MGGAGRRPRPRGKTALTRGLLKSGADIYEMNTVRRHLSRIKGGRLSKATPARMLTLAISDVPGDDPATIGSGPTVPDPTTLAEARAVLDRRAPRDAGARPGHPAGGGHASLRDPANETPKPGDAAFASAEYRIIATPGGDRSPRQPSWQRRAGYDVVNLGERRDRRGARGGAGPCHAGAARPRRRAAGWRS